MFYVYKWFNIDTKEIFYVGKGTRNRYKDKKRRNKLFLEYISKNNCDCSIIEYYEKEEDAFKKEHELICKLKSKGMCSCNLDNGGLGGVNFVWTDEMREYYSKYNVMKSETQRKRMSKNNPMKIEEIKNKVCDKISKKIIIGTKKYNSIKQASIEYGVRDTNVHYWLSRGYNNKGELCYYEGTKELNIKIKNHACNKRKVIINDKEFETVKDGAKYLGITSSKLINIIKSNKPYKNKYFCKYDNQQPSHENTDKSIVEGSTTR